MSVQEIKSNIHELVNDINDEDKLQAFYIIITSMTKEVKQPPKQSKKKALKAKEGQNSSKKSNDLAKPLVNKEQKEDTHKWEERAIPHDLSLVFLANEIFKGSQPLPEEGEIAFERAFKKSLKKEPTLPNRL